MTRFSKETLADFLGRPAMLVVVARESADQPEGELYLAIDGDGNVTGFNGHVDLGTGIRTALAQIVAEELDVPFEAVRMVLGHTEITPNQGATIASETIQVTASPLRRAAATARKWLLEEAGRQFDLVVADISILDGHISARESNRSATFGELIGDRSIKLKLDADAPLKPVGLYRLVGRSQPRVDLPAKATGTWIYVHDVRVPEMLHGRVVRPPYFGSDTGTHIGHSLLGVDERSISHIPGIVSLVVIGDFIGIVAEREEHADEAARSLRVRWTSVPQIADLNAPEQAIRTNPHTTRHLLDRGDVDRALRVADERIERTYVWPYQMHASIGPSCAVADVKANAVTVWSGTQNPLPLRADIARLLDIDEASIKIERLEASGCYGRNCADDAAADAVLLSDAVRRPVRVQLTRQQEHAWEPKGAAQVIDVRGALDLEGGPSAYDFQTRYPSNGAPTLALLLTGKVAAIPIASEMGDRTAIPPYAYPNARVTVHDMPAIVRASWFRGVSALPNTFAHESFIDELAIAADVDPIEYRLRYLPDERARELVRAVAERAKWVPHSKPGTLGGAGDIVFGRGFAYAVYVHGPFPGKAAAWAAWVADVAVNKVTGEVAVTRVVAGQDAGLMINPDGVKHQIHGNVIQSTSRVLKEAVGFSPTGVSSLEWGSYPIIRFPELPEIDVLMMDRHDDPPLGAGESTSVPSAAAIANAVFDATGIRFRDLPLTPERVRAALNPLPPPKPQDPTSRPAARRRWGFLFPSVLAGVLSFATTALPWRSAIDPIARPLSNVFSKETIERGRLAAALGACNVCHVGPGGQAFGGGRPIHTPFGTVYASNISPDTQTGIGAWSYPAFVRAVQDGVSRDGRHLYPAHPYTSFVRADEADLEALYAYFMSRPAVAAATPATRLKFPFNLRPLMAGWNAVFLQRSLPTVSPDNAALKRGAYLVEGLGHCSACHSPRNALGAEIRGRRHLSGGTADGWTAHALTADSAAPVPWTEDAFYDYLRTGHARLHGSASGPMRHVIEALEPLPDADIRAMAVYLSSLNTDRPSKEAVAAQAQEMTRAAVKSADLAAQTWPAAARLFEGACAMCHEQSPDTSLLFNSSLHADRADNVVTALLHGVEGGNKPGAEGLDANMPAFNDSLSDEQTIDLANYMRQRFAPEKTQWRRLAETVREIRRTTNY